MLDISLSVFRLYGAPVLGVKPREGGGATLYLQDSSDEYPTAGEITVHMQNVDAETIQSAIRAFNREIQHGLISGRIG
jgi:hypothetical protein